MKSNESSTRKTGNRALPKPHCVVKVGEGRGFVFEFRVPVPRSVRLQLLGKLRLRLPNFKRRRVVLTAAHCLGNLPPAHAMAFFWERTYKDLLGSLDGSKNDVCAECLFVDPVADIAVLGCPDQQEMWQQAEAYHALVDEAPAVRIGKPRSGRAWVLTLDGHWTRTPVKVRSGVYRLLGAMSHSVFLSTRPQDRASPRLFIGFGRYSIGLERMARPVQIAQF